MRDQLRIVARTDILVGMHGAGLSHALFLPSHGGLIEFYPTYYTSDNVHFKQFSQWRRLHYVRWVNTDMYLERNGDATLIPPSVLLALMHNMLDMMGCAAPDTEHLDTEHPDAKNLDTRNANAKNPDA